MSHDAACADLIRKGFGTRIITRETTIATVEEAAATVGVGVERIAKTLSFLQNGRPVLIVAAGNVKIDNRKYKDRFGVKASMIPGASNSWDMRPAASVPSASARASKSGWTRP